MNLLASNRFRFQQPRRFDVRKAGACCRRLWRRRRGAFVCPQCRHSFESTESLFIVDRHGDYDLRKHREGAKETKKSWHSSNRQQMFRNAVRVQCTTTRHGKKSTPL